jgi:signal transduction histidine kinase/CheY-like chemotaxis protein
MSASVLQRARHALFEQRWITAALAVLLLATSLLLGWQMERRESADQLRQVNVQAQILAGSVAGALAFDDKATANEYLSALRLDESFRGAAIYGADGRLFAGLATPGQALPARVTVHPPEIGGRKATVVVPVIQENLNLGTVYLTKVVEPLSTRISRYAAIGFILLFAAALIALLGAASAAAAAANRELQQQVLAREKAESALRQAQKMEALGQLTGGVAHDFNNLLMAASSGLELMQRSKDADRRQRFAEGIRNALERGAQITQQLLAFSCRSPLQSEVLNVDRHIDDLANLLDHSLRENVSVRFSIAGDLWPIEIDVSQFDVAMLNLAVNAKDAMPQGGQLCITAANRPGALAGTDAVEIAVEDEGGGMGADTIERAFEPFYTTKGPGRGTGLGLSQVYGFVTAAGGTVSIVSEPGKGTKVILLVPRSHEQVDEQDQATAPPPAEDALQGLRILLVEDDPNLNELVSEMLEEQGSQVLRAASGAEGLSLFDSNTVDAVVSDMVMPGAIGGLDLARQLRERREGFPVVLMTGYSAAAGSAAAEGFPVLRKPFTMAALTAGLSLALRRAG